jgi:5-methylcytosine-specific restriction endonuclease McrA
MCIIGQKDRCDSTGCEWIKGFGYHCTFRTRLDRPPFIESVIYPKTRFSVYPKYLFSMDRKEHQQKIKTETTKSDQPGPTPSNRSIVFKSSGGFCYICKEALTRQNRTIDHVIPLSRGGKNHISNLRACCGKCNNLKGSMLLSEIDMTEFMHRRYNNI